MKGIGSGEGEIICLLVNVHAGRLSGLENKLVCCLKMAANLVGIGV